eukprot:TRINITY_DN15600_c0_g1_i1.p1 TRINITY_DN15600_c0_g1~~TRINITY_DN15600_c0_g1_i1.p1  ORF type:complete len:138 (+),score=32.73 TRINITY_DN15600_c0_g1_i1:71-484(+)
MEAFKGKFERNKQENFEEFLKALDCGMLFRKAATISSPVMEISESGGGWCLKTSTTMKTMELKFKLGEKFDEHTTDGRDTSTVVNVDNGKIVTVQTAKKAGQKSTRSIREMTGPDTMLFTIMIEGTDVSCTQTFKRI